jgi:response regulator RpfG family c-di-GMP phosphodiesterase
MEVASRSVRPPVARQLGRVLCVDDEPQVLEGLSVNLRRQFEVRTATGGPEALALLTQEPPFEVVMSDMRMPGMDGAAFLAKVREVMPDTVRMLLTGQADIASAVAAVNDGQIFRFLLKPCPKPQLVAALDAAVSQYRLVTGERHLLEQTLGGSIKMLTEVLSLAAPTAFSRSSSLKACVSHVVARLGLPDAWQYELAALLSQLGCITLPPETLDKVYAGQELSPEEQAMYARHPETAHRLLAHIPRLETVAAIIRHQTDAAGGNAGTPSDPMALGAAILRLAQDFDRRLVQGKPVASAIGELRDSGLYEPRLLAALEGFRPLDRAEVVRSLAVRELRMFMVLDEDVHARNGAIVMRKGAVLSRPLIERLLNFSQGLGIIEPIRVRIPT